MNENRYFILDCLRGASALYVMLHHYQSMFPPQFKFLLSFGQEAVILFFMITGFLMMNSYDKKSLSPKLFLLKRLQRILPILITSIVLTILIKIITGTYSGINWIELSGNILFLQDTSLKPGVWFMPYQGNYPLWSLSYIWWFYVFFAISAKEISERKWAIFIIPFVASIIYWIYPNQPSLFIWYALIFITGCILYQINKYNLFKIKSYLSFICISFLNIIGIVILWVYNLDEYPTIGVHPFLELRHFSTALIFFFISIVYIFYISRGLKDKVEKILFPFSLIAPFSYTLFLVHIPIIWLLSSYIENSSLLLIMGIIVSFSLSYLIEVKKYYRIFDFKYYKTMIMNL